MRLREQYTIVIGGLVFACLLVLGLTLGMEQVRYAREIREATSLALRQALERQSERNGVALAASLAARLVTPLYHRDEAQVIHEIAEIQEYPEVLSVKVLDAAGVVVHDGTRSNAIRGSSMEAPWPREAMQRGMPVVSRELASLRVAAPVLAGTHALGVALVELSTADTLGDVLVEQARMAGLVRNHAASFGFTGVGVGLVLLVFAILMAVFTAGRLAGPVVAFAAQARSIGRGERVRSERARRKDEIGDLARAFDEMAETLQATTVSKDWFDNVLRSMADMLLVIDAGGRVVTANPSCLAELGCPADDIRGITVDRLLPRLAASTGQDENGTARPSWLELHRPSGGVIPVHVSVAPLREGPDAQGGSVIVMQNVSERLASERRIEASLVEKEILLREIHHRVKNNLQIISSMLSLQGERTDDESVRAVFQESEIRIRAMALVHEQLYRSGDLAHVDLGSYLDTLVRQVQRWFGRSDCEVVVHVDDEVREVGVDQAIPVGLVVNELVANCIEHGFAGGRPGTVAVSLLARESGRELMVRDDGAGLPAGFDIEASETLGLKLVRALADQLGATLSIDGSAGTTVRLLLPPARARASAPREPSPEDAGTASVNPAPAVAAGPSKGRQAAA